MVWIWQGDERCMVRTNYTLFTFWLWRTMDSLRNFDSFFVSFFVPFCLGFESAKLCFVTFWFLMPNWCIVHRFASFSISFSLSQISSFLYFIASLFLCFYPCPNRLSISISMYFLILTGFFFFFLVIYNERLLNGVVALLNHIIYHFFKSYMSKF